MKLDENICIAPHCEETKLLVDRGCPFCTEHITKFKDFFSRYEVSSEIDYLIKNNEEFRKEFLNDMVYDFFDEEEQEYHRKNKQVSSIKKEESKAKKQKEKEKTKVDKKTMKKVENKDTINHNLMIVDVDLQKCLNCSFMIQKVDEQ